MVTKAELDAAKVAWEQAVESANLAHEYWRDTASQRKSVVESSVKAGMSKLEAVQGFEDSLEHHSAQFDGAYKHMARMSETFARVLAEWRSQQVN